MKAYTQSFAQLACAASLIFAVNASQATTIIEPFNGGQLSAPGWSTGIGADASIFLTTPAPDGTYGIALSEGVWSYNTTLSFVPGQTLSAWINPGPSADVNSGTQGGRVYLGFDAGAGGAYSFVAASDSNELGFQNNAGYNLPAFANSVAQSYNDQWYLLSVNFNVDGSSATASLFDTDGVTLLNSITQTGLSASSNGIALRGVGGAAITSIAEVPLPSTLALMAFGLLGFWKRSRG